MQLELICTLQQIRCSFLDLFFIGLNFFDTGAFFFLLIPALWFGKSWKAGLRLFSIILLSTFVIQKLKIFFGLPRPFHLIPSLGIIQVPGNGFPSGGATNAMLLSCLLLTYGKIRFKKTIAFSFLFFVSLSRIYLGVHFITDVLGGLVLGLLLFTFFALTYKSIEKWLKKRSLPFLFCLSWAIPLILFFFNPIMRNICFIAIGIFSSLFIKKPIQPKSLQESLMKGALGAFLSFLLYLIFNHLFHPKAPLLKSFFSLVIGFGIGTLGAYLCNKASFLKGRKTNER